MDDFLTKEYSPSAWSERLSADRIVTAHGDVLKKNSDIAYENVPHFSLDLSNGKSKEQCLEIFYKNQESFSAENERLDFHGKKVFIYLHGGYWQWGSVYWSSFMAKNFVEKDIVVVALGHDIAPGATMTEMISQVEKGVAKVLANSNESEVYICGHSAGAHLASLILFTDFKAKYGIESSKGGLRGMFLVSGIFDLTPLLKTDINDNVKMDLKEAQYASPMFKNETPYLTEQNKSDLKVLLVYGENESGSFKQQAENFTKHLKLDLKMNNVKCKEIEAVDHFNLIEDIRLDEFSLTKEIYANMNLGESTDKIVE